MSNCRKCKYLTVDYEFDTEYMCTVAVERCTIEKNIFTVECDYFEEKKVKVDENDL